MAETWQKLIRMKQEEGAEKAELHQLWKKMIQLLKDSTRNQDNKTGQLVMFLTPCSARYIYMSSAPSNCSLFV